MKKWIWIIAAGILAVVLIAFKLNSAKKDQYVFGVVKKENIVEVVSESGTVSSNDRTDIFSPTNGLISKVYVSNGDIVKEGQKLFDVKSTATSQEKSEALAIYQAAKSTVQQAENNRRMTLATVTRVHDDVKDHDKDETFLQKEIRTTAEVANDNAWSALLAAQAQLNAAQKTYYATLNSTVTAPVAGTISNLSVTTGGGVTINNPMIGVTPVLIVNSNQKTEISITVGDSDINKIKTGQICSIKFDAIEGKSYHGIVERFDNSGSISQGVAKYNVYIVMSDPDEMIKPGMSADVDITTKELKDVLGVPSTSVKPYQKGRAVRILNSKGVLEYIPVKIGVRGKDYVEILEGLKEGQQIILSLPGDNPSKKSLF